MKVVIELDIEIVDSTALERAALASIDAADIVADDGEDVEGVKSELRNDVRNGGPESALIALVDPYNAVPEDVGIVCHGSTHYLRSEHPDQSVPDFDALFEVCRCGEDESCDRCSGFQLTPRTANVLWSLAQILSDRGFDDVENNGDDVVDVGGEWSLFDEYPLITYRQDAVWRRQAARSFDDLAGDLAAGAWPRPTCPAEEMALHLVLELGEAAVAEDWFGEPDRLSTVPAHDDDFDWEMAGEVFLQDVDMLSLFDNSLDGIADPDSEQNRLIGMGDYRPDAWFKPFDNMPRRDGRRPFRR